MHLQVLASGSGGNAALVRAGEAHLLLDAGLAQDELEERLERARVPLRRIDHIALTHGHLDHARSGGSMAERARACLHAAHPVLRRRSARRAPRLSVLGPERRRELRSGLGDDVALLDAVAIPHDSQPTMALRVEHESRVLVLVTDMGRPDREAARRLAGAHLIVLEFNHDEERLREGPYAPRLKRRIGGPNGHLSNRDAARMLAWLAGPELHTVVLAHLSRTNNSPELALAAAHEALAGIGLGGVRVLVAEQDELGPNLRV